MSRSENFTDFAYIQDLVIGLNKATLSPSNAATSSSADSDSVFHQVVQINGRRVYGPPNDWTGPEPSNACELFIKKIPPIETDLLPHLQRFGRIYQYRVMTDFENRTRGFAYVKYTNETDALRCLEVMNHFYIQRGVLLEIQRSYDKCRFYVTNIPKHLRKEIVECEMRKLFPEMSGLVFQSKTSGDQNINRGYVFVDFPNHTVALRAKQKVNLGNVTMFGREIKIIWAYPTRSIDPNEIMKITTLFVRNIPTSTTNRELLEAFTKRINRTSIRKISRVKDVAFLELDTHETAEYVLNNNAGILLKDHIIHLEWALPASNNAVSKFQQNDFDNILRLKCIANYWNPPIILFGSVYENSRVQYAALAIERLSGYNVFFVALPIIKNLDIHSRLCEVVVKLIEDEGDLPNNNYVIIVENEIIHIVGEIEDLRTRKFIKVSNLPDNLYIHWIEILDLTVAMHFLMCQNKDVLYSVYQQSLCRHEHALLPKAMIMGKLFGCINPNYRKKEPLKYNLNNMQMIFVLCTMITMTNYGPLLDTHNELTNIQDIECGNLKKSIEYRSGILLSNQSTIPQTNDVCYEAIYFGKPRIK